MADNKLIGQNYTTPDLVAKVTGKAKYAEDYRIEGMLFCKLLVSPYPHARVTHLDTSAAMAHPGVKGIITADDMPGAAAGATLGEGVQASQISERGLTNEPLYQGEPILALAAVREDDEVVPRPVEPPCDALQHLGAERLDVVGQQADHARPPAAQALRDEARFVSEFVDDCLHPCVRALGHAVPVVDDLGHRGDRDPRAASHVVDRHSPVLRHRSPLLPFDNVFNND